MSTGRTQRPLLRILAFLTAVSLALMPHILNAQRTTLLPDDVATVPVPVNEEEAPSQSTTPLHMVGLANPMSALQPMQGVHTDDEPLCGAHGEVPHPPPWW